MVHHKFFVNVMFAFATVFCATQVYSQVIFREDSNTYGWECNATSYCTPIIRCRFYRESNDWGTVGITCGSGSGMNRRVCCPRRPTQRGEKFIETTPSTTIPITVLDPRSEDDTNCGQNRLFRAPPPFVILVNGIIAREGSWPWMVAIRIRENSGVYTPWCTGFLIDRRHVLSAAHCFDRREIDLYRARIGRVNQDEADEYTFNRIVIPEGYRIGYFYDDIALLTLSREVNTPDFVPICLPNDQILPRDLTGMEASAAGWGALRPIGNPSRLLQELRNIPIISNQECNRTFQNQLRGFRHQFPRGFSVGFLCTGFLLGERDACVGDSGGPLMLFSRNRWVAVGIVSFGYSCAIPGIPGGYTRVSNYLDWIRENTSD